MRVVFFLFLLAGGIPVYAQQGKTTVSGTVIDKNTQQPVEFVNVLLLNKKDSTTLNGTITDKKEIQHGGYCPRELFYLL